MDALKFLLEYGRMCDSVTDCKHCLVGEIFKPDTKESCRLYAVFQPKDVVKAVEKWSAAHPQKTRKDDFLEKYPNAQLKLTDGTPIICAEYLGYCKCEYMQSSKACAKCWNTPLE